MAEIEKEVIGDKAVTVFKVKGKMLFDQVIDEITQFYEKGLTQNTVWDFTGADGGHITSDEIQKIAFHAKGFGHLRENGKTAFVISSSLAYGLGRMYDSLAQVFNHPVRHGIFRSFDDAILWVQSTEAN
ncbi:MAG: hypothetical protein JW927_05575 [Deltaproteobacteria bacterium]|nr:hypothetical protein [Deltaproteobacteria bacterium]